MALQAWRSGASTPGDMSPVSALTPKAAPPSFREPSVPIIRHMAEEHGRDLEDISESLRQHVFRSYRPYKVAVLVSDMCGFTRLTRQHGIIHFASIIARLRQLCLPIMHKYGAWLITTEGDSFNVIFPAVENALLAASSMLRAASTYNSALPPERSHFRLTLDGIGVDYGWGPILDKSGKLHGKTFEYAHVLGEEVCKGTMIAVSQSAATQIEESSAFRGTALTPLEPTGANEEIVEAFAEMGGAFKLEIEHTERKRLLVGVDDDGFLQAALTAFAQRHAPELSASGLEELDALLRSRHMIATTVLMFEFEFDNAEDEERQLALKYDCLSRLSGILSQHGGQELEDILYLFRDPVDAILAALSCRRDVNEALAGTVGSTEPAVRIKGFGVHIGDLLYIEGTDVHWGDPVNTASKLGQDTARNGEVVISRDTFAACQDDPRLNGLRFHQFHFVLSGVEFHPYKVLDAVQCES